MTEDVSPLSSSGRRLGFNETNHSALFFKFILNCFFSAALTVSQFNNGGGA